MTQITSKRFAGVAALAAIGVTIAFSGASAQVASGNLKIAKKNIQISAPRANNNVQQAPRKSGAKIFSLPPKAPRAADNSTNTKTLKSVRPKSPIDPSRQIVVDAREGNKQPFSLPPKAPRVSEPAEQAPQIALTRPQTVEPDVAQIKTVPENNTEPAQKVTPKDKLEPASPKVQAWADDAYKRYLDWKTQHAYKSYGHGYVTHAPVYRHYNYYRPHRIHRHNYSYRRHVPHYGYRVYRSHQYRGYKRRAYRIQRHAPRYNYRYSYRGY